MDTKEARICYISAMVVCAMAEIEGMKAENMQRQHLGQSMAYCDNDFFNVINKYGIHHNSVIGYLNG